MVLAFAMLSHFLLDFPVHADDAHQHFWPLTNWRFHSPFSYWDSAHHAASVAILELSIILLCSIVLWQRFKHWAVRIGVIVITMMFFGTYFYFSLVL